MTESSDTTAVREAHRFDEARLAAWLESHVAGYAGPLTVRQFKGGQSNPTYKLIEGISRISHADRIARKIGFSRADIAKYLTGKG